MVLTLRRLLHQPKWLHVYHLTWLFGTCTNHQSTTSPSTNTYWDQSTLSPFPLRLLDPIQTSCFQWFFFRRASSCETANYPPHPPTQSHLSLTVCEELNDPQQLCRLSFWKVLSGSNIKLSGKFGQNVIEVALVVKITQTKDWKCN